MASKTVNVKISPDIWPSIRPWATIIKENSEIWANEIDVKNDVLLLYPKKEPNNQAFNQLFIAPSFFQVL